MPARNKEGTQLLVSPHLKMSAQLMAIARQESTAEIYRTALEPALDVMVRKSDVAQRLLVVLDGMKVDRKSALQYMIDHRLRYADLFDADGAPRKSFPGAL
jgi:hypothetical protein